MRLLIVGPQGAGKGTQASLLAEHLGIPHISTGDIFRANVGAGTELGVLAKTYMDAGDLVPDEVTVAMVAARFDEPDAGRGFLLDGFPRTVPQADKLGEILIERGEDVDKVREATELVRERDPKLKVDGPIQFDAAIDPTVGKKKMPGSEVAGQATVFVFPDLNTGNNTYKAVQRSSGAIAIGPVLQGLRKPVNDLSRGALVRDIVNTVAITAIQAQAAPHGTPSPFAEQ